MEPLTPELLLTAYASGYFPMAESRDSDELHWYCPDPRAVIPLDAFHVPRSLAKAMRKHPFSITHDKAFADVIRSCAKREETWINDEIIDLYCTLHEMGYAHSVESWKDGTLEGGLYGVSLGCAFFGESMFSNSPNASRVALVYLVELLKHKGFMLLDTQFVNPHLVQFGVVEIPRDDYLEQLKRAAFAAPKEIW